MQVDHRVTIDGLRRDPSDGAYHCPKCKAPFTRRSNLRRHYHIHIRSVEINCPLCNEPFNNNDDLHVHFPQCPNKHWNTDPSLHNTQLLNTNESYNHDLMDLGMMRATQINDMHNYNRTSNISNIPFPTPDQFAVQNHDDPAEFANFLSTLSAMNDTSSPMASSSDTSSPSTCESDFDFSRNHRRPSSSSSASSLAPSPPSFFSSSYPQLPETCLPSGTQPDGFNDTNNAANLARIRSRDVPVYTRRQVEDMLQIVNNCFVKTIDSLTGRTGVLASDCNGYIPPPFQAASQEFQRRVLSEVLPHLIGANIQNNSNGAFPTGNPNGPL